MAWHCCLSHGKHQMHIVSSLATDLVLQFVVLRWTVLLLCLLPCIIHHFGAPACPSRESRPRTGYKLLEGAPMSGGLHVLR